MFPRRAYIPSVMEFSFGVGRIILLHAGAVSPNASTFYLHFTFSYAGWQCCMCRAYILSVMEPSFGLGRIIHCMLAHCFYVPQSPVHLR